MFRIVVIRLHHDGNDAHRHGHRKLLGLLRRNEAALALSIYEGVWSRQCRKCLSKV